MNWREASLWALLFAFLFGVGWFRGSHPDFHWQDYFYASKPIVILTPNREWLPEPVIERLSKEADQEIKVEVVEEFADFEARLIPADAPPILWIPSSWAEALGAQGLLADLSSVESQIKTAVSPDFFFNGASRTYFVPMLWAIEEQSLRVEGLAIPHSGLDRPLAFNLLRHWLETDNALAHTREVSAAASALQSLNDQDLPQNKRARSLRDYDFKTLNIR